MPQIPKAAYTYPPSINASTEFATRSNIVTSRRPAHSDDTDYRSTPPAPMRRTKG